MTWEQCPPVLLGIDWGSTSLRGYLIAENGEVLASRETKHGVFHLPPGGFEAAFDYLISGWEPLSPTLPILACGMVGSAQGWMEVPYVSCPMTVTGIAAGIAAKSIGNGRMLHVVPGMASHGVLPDVMRGEETQVIGALAARATKAGEMTIVLPGTHSKWVQVRDGSITRIETFMTGELFELLRVHSSIGRVAATVSELAEEGEGAFRRGVHDAIDARNRSVTHLMFTTRSQVLLGKLASDQALDYLSGLLIGEELRRQSVRGDCVLVGSAELCDRYEQAFAVAFDFQPDRSENAAARGLHLLARSAGLI